MPLLGLLIAVALRGTTWSWISGNGCSTTGRLWPRPMPVAEP